MANGRAWSCEQMDRAAARLKALGREASLADVLLTLELTEGNA